MQPFMIDMLLSGLVYLIMIYFLYMMLRKRDHNQDDNGDGGDGGITVDVLPDLDLPDLPPGVCLPGQGPTRTPKDTPVADPEPVTA